MHRFLDQETGAPRLMVMIVALAVVVAGSGCTDKESAPARDLTRRERDSIIGESVLPGAQGVRGALRAADSAAARQERAAAIR